MTSFVLKMPLNLSQLTNQPSDKAHGRVELNVKVIMRRMYPDWPQCWAIA